MVFDEYSLAGGGPLGAEVLAYCPWCGTPLPRSKRDLWFGELVRMGIDPDDPRLDERYRSDAWWRSLPGAASDGTATGDTGSGHGGPPANGAGDARSPGGEPAAGAGGDRPGADR